MIQKLTKNTWLNTLVVSTPIIHKYFVIIYSIVLLRVAHLLFGLSFKLDLLIDYETLKIKFLMFIMFNL